MVDPVEHAGGTAAVRKPSGRGRHRASDPGGSRPATLDADTAHLLQTAAQLAASQVRRPTGPWDEARLATFLQVYRRWIIHALGLSDAPEEWAERSAILLHLMVGGATIGEAIDMLVRFAKTVWSKTLRFEYVDNGEWAKLIVHEPDRADEQGLICALWSLRAALAQIEFLAGGPLDGVTGHVRSDQCLPGTITSLLFGRPLVFAAEHTALVFPKAEHHRAIAVRAADIPEFQRNFMRSMVGAYHGANDVRALITNLICDDRIRGATETATMPDVTRRLGLSVASARRRLHADGVTFRKLKEDVLDQLAKMWLREKGRTIEGIAEHLGYSDGHAFRRAFRRRNGLSPRAFRVSSLSHLDAPAGRGSDRL